MLVESDAPESATSGKACCIHRHLYGTSRNGASYDNRDTLYVADFWSHEKQYALYVALTLTQPYLRGCK